MDDVSLLIIGLYLLTVALLILSGAVLFKGRRRTRTVKRPRDAWPRVAQAATQHGPAPKDAPRCEKHRPRDTAFSLSSTPTAE